ncbi:hypothetical protein E4T43_04567 [Aureobasidium subglaciale]|nr:hypothetical protein E4T43_04567 [Aureobasidium subglaciale]
MSSLLPFDAATKFCSQRCFHQSIILPATADHAPLRVSYATTTNFCNESLPVVLFCHPMGAARYLIFEFEEMAKKEDVRVVIIDRPSFGGSTPVELDQRVNVFIEAVAAVLENLRVKHVALVSHSAGTIYLANVLLRLPQLLHPERPFAGVIGKLPLSCLFLPFSSFPLFLFLLFLSLFSLSFSPADVEKIAPWVHPKFSNAGLMQVVDKLPTSWLANLHNILGFVNGSIAPSLHFSSAMLGLTSGLNEQDCQTWHGMNKETWDEVGKLQVKYSGLEDKRWAFYGLYPFLLLLFLRPREKLYQLRESIISGISADAQLCMQKDARDWGVYANLPSLVASLAQAYPQDTRTLTLQACFAETDIMIGKGGQEYFVKCWKEGNGNAAVEFESRVVKDTDHDSILPAEKGCIGEVFKQVKRLNG